MGDTSPICWLYQSIKQRAFVLGEENKHLADFHVFFLSFNPLPFLFSVFFLSFLLFTLSLYPSLSLSLSPLPNTLTGCLFVFLIIGMTGLCRRAFNSLTRTFSHHIPRDLLSPSPPPSPASQRRYDMNRGGTT
jgi:hypothetical protein